MVQKARHSVKKVLIAIITILLISIVIFSATTMLHSRLIPLGSSLFEDYIFLRSDLKLPDCNLSVDIEKEVAKQVSIAKNNDDNLDDLFDPEPINEQAIRTSVKNQLASCKAKYTTYDANSAKLTPAVETYRDFEHFIGTISETGVKLKKITVLLLLILCALMTTLSNHHIALRPIYSIIEHRISHTVQFVANACLFLSIHRHREMLSSSITDPTTQALLLITQLGFGLFLASNLYRLAAPPIGLEKKTFRFNALLTVPLVSIMALIGSYYFRFYEENFEGLSIYFKQLPDHATIFINVGLYIWVGMMLKQTQLGRLIFNCIKPWKLTPPMLAGLVVLLMGFPTAYTGASGIIIIALGGVIYQEMRLVKTPRPLALATTAMSGSLGVVLSPCLLVALIAALNREVTTDQLYGWGIWVFMLTASLFAATAYLFGGRFKRETQDPFPLMQTLSHLKQLTPYAVITIAIVFTFAWFLNAPINKDTAPVIVPALVLSFLAYEHRPSGPAATTPLGDIIGMATRETAVHIGALLLLMGLSLIVGGMIERSEIVHLLPDSFHNVWIAMTLLCAALVILGMTMDPFGAVILVTGTISGVGYMNGIHPIHFWMTALVAFELGYLTPPVAINQLLTRQVIGEKEMLEAKKEASKGVNWWEKHLQFGLPLLVMLIALLVVAFAPLPFYEYQYSVYQLSQ